MKIVDIFLIFAQNIDRGYTLEPPHRGGSNEYPQSMFKSKNKKIMSCKPQFYYIKVGCKGVYISRTCLHDAFTTRLRNKLLTVPCVTSVVIILLIFHLSN